MPKSTTPPRKATLAQLAKRVERLEDTIEPTPLILAHPRGTPGHHLPEVDIDGRRLSWAERAMTVVYPGRPPRLLRPGELEVLQRRFGDRLRMPFIPKIGEITRGARRTRDDDDDDGEE